MNKRNSTKSEKPLADMVHVSRRFLRSIRLDTDIEELNLVDSYIITAQARRVLQGICAGLQPNATERSWTITGPYGTGKSAFILFLIHLLRDPSTKTNPAWQKLNSIDPILVAELRQAFLTGNGKTRGFLPVLVTGRRISASVCLLEGLYSALESFKANSRLDVIKKHLMTQLNRDKNCESIDSRAVIDIISNLAETVANDDKYSGLLIIIDELGKIFEYAAWHPDRGDIFVLQELAEISLRVGNCPILNIGVLHQSFDQYSQYLDKTTQREWAKVQGRFTDVAYLESPVQMMRLIASAIENTNGKLPTKMANKLHRIAEISAASDLCPLGMDKEEFKELVICSWPLHPTVLVALPFLFRKFAQNERSLFSFLSSHEPYGFQYFINRLILDPANLPFIRLSEVFDYFIANFGGSLYRHHYAKRWAEAADTIDRIRDPQPLELQVLKTIGLLTVLGEVSPLRGERDIIQLALTDAHQNTNELESCLQSLIDKSLIIYRRFSQTYRLWEGSDIDIEERMKEGKRKTKGQLGLAETIQRYLPSKAIVARRHSYRNGALRFFNQVYVDNLDDLSSPNTFTQQADGTILCFLPRSLTEAKRFRQWVKETKSARRRNLLIVIPRQTAHIREVAEELNALHWVWENTLELRNDRVARRELSERIFEVEVLLTRSVENLFHPGKTHIDNSCDWFYKGEKRHINEPADISRLLSEIMDKVYHKSPKVKNELINRRVLSASASAARRNLVEQMLSYVDKPTLNIEGYPPERSMYESLLGVTGIHRFQGQGAWGFVSPEKRSAGRLLPVWSAMEHRIFNESPKPISVDLIFSELEAPPYGVMPGILPVLLCAFFIKHKDEMSLYKDGVFLPEASIADFEVMMRRPDLFAVAGCKAEGERMKVLQRMAKGLDVQPATVPVVRALIRNAKSLPNHAWRTQRLPESVRAVREAFEKAKSPEQLLYSDLPYALGVAPLSANETSKSEVDQFFSALNNTLKSWQQITTKVISDAQDTLLDACELPPGDAGWAQLRIQAVRLENVVTHPKLLPFIRRISMDGDDQTVLESVLALVANRPPQSWTDNDVDQFPMLAKSIGDLFTQAVQACQPSNFSIDYFENLSDNEKIQSKKVVRQFSELLGSNYYQSYSSRSLRAALLQLLQKVEKDFGKEAN